ncbi:MAG: DUF1028 domain-containing protein [Betaproteobacteria bacterium]
MRAKFSRASLLAGPLALLLVQAAPAQIYRAGEEGTFSIIGRDPATGELGIAVQSRTIAVGSRTRGGKAGVAVFAHQAASNPMYSAIGVQLLEAGLTPQEALDMMLRSDEGRDTRQVAILDAQGRTAAWTGPATSDWKGHKCGVNYCAEGNTLTGPEVVDAMARSFESSSGPLAERLLSALEAGQAAGGDRRGTESAGLLILKPRAIQGFGDRALDLRVDEHRAPIPELRRILDAVRSGEMVSKANAALARGDRAAALDLARAASEKSPTNDNAWVAIARVRLEMGSKAEALAALAHAVELNPANKRQLPRNEAFESLYKDPEFLRIVK